MNNTGVCGLTAQKLSLSMREFGPRNSAYAVNLTYETNRHIHNTNWASEASPTLGCSIEISRDIIYMYLLHTSPAHCTFFNDA